jgi:hypothetical protein
MVVSFTKSTGFFCLALILADVDPSIIFSDTAGIPVQSGKPRDGAGARNEINLA